MEAVYEVDTGLNNTVWSVTENQLQYNGDHYQRDVVLGVSAVAKTIALHSLLAEMKLLNNTHVEDNNNDEGKDENEECVQDIDVDNLPTTKRY